MSPNSGRRRRSAGRTSMRKDREGRRERRERDQDMSKEGSEVLTRRHLVTRLRKCFTLKPADICVTPAGESLDEHVGDGQTVQGEGRLASPPALIK